MILIMVRNNRNLLSYIIAIFRTIISGIIIVIIIILIITIIL